MENHVGAVSDYLILDGALLSGRYFGFSVPVYVAMYICSHRRALGHLLNCHLLTGAVDRFQTNIPTLLSSFSTSVKNSNYVVDRVPAAGSEGWRIKIPAVDIPNFGPSHYSHR